MARYCRTLSIFVADDAGTTSVEYALIALIVGVGIVSALGTFTGILLMSLDRDGWV